MARKATKAANQQPTSIDQIEHGVTSTGQQRAKDLAAVIETEKSRRISAGATRVECLFGQKQGTLTIVTWG